MNGIGSQAAWKLGVRGTVYLVSALLVTLPVAPQQAPARLAATARPGGEAEEAPRKAGQPGSGAIKVHGHWVIDVKNADGTLVEHRDFQNSLVGGSGLATISGDQIIAGALTGDLIMGGLAIAFLSDPASNAKNDPSSACNGTAVLQPPAPAQVQCYLLYSPDSLFPKVLQYMSPLGGPQPGLSQTASLGPDVSIVLAANYKVPIGLKQIDAVQTYAAFCSWTGIPRTNARLSGTNLPIVQAEDNGDTCAKKGMVGTPSNIPGDTLFGALTSTSLAAPLTGLAAGQIITVKVTIWFS